MRKITPFLVIASIALASGSALALDESKETKETAQLAPAATTPSTDPVVKAKKAKKKIARNDTTAKPLKSKTVETPGQTKGEESGGAAGSSGSSGSAGNGG